MKKGLKVSIMVIAAIAALLILLLAKMTVVALYESSVQNTMRYDTNKSAVSDIQEESMGGDGYVDPLITLVQPTAPYHAETPIRPEVVPSDPMYGSNEAGVTMVLFCDHVRVTCQDAVQTVRRYIDEHAKNEIQLVWKDFPSPLVEGAREAAIAGRCAHMQGRFWEFNNLLGIKKQEAGIKDYGIIVEELDLDVEKFNECIQGHEAMGWVNQGIEDAQRMEVDSAPTLFVGPYRLEEEIAINEVDQLMELMHE